jgi:AcrR family transcriptional regulator
VPREQSPATSDAILAATTTLLESGGYEAVQVREVARRAHVSLASIYRRYATRGDLIVAAAWEKTPWMLEAYHKAEATPAGARLRDQGASAIVPAAMHLLGDRDPEYTADVETILVNMAYAVTGRFIEGQIPATAILPALERAVHRLTTDNREVVTRRDDQSA